jgi:hypothetical protein
MISERRENEVNETKTAGPRLPMQAAVDRSANLAALTEGFGVEASQVQDPNSWWLNFHPVDPPNLVGFPLLRWTSARSVS